MAPTPTPSVLTAASSRETVSNASHASPISRWKTSAMLISVCGATFLNTFQGGCITVALPTMQKALSISEANIQWPVSVYSLTYGCFLLLSGRLADIIGRRRVFLLGTGWFALMSICVAFARNEMVLIVLMALMGLGAALNTPAGVGIIGAHFDGAAKPLAFGAMATAQPLGFIIGLCLAGFLCQTRVSWPSLFYIQASLALLFFLAGYFSLPERNSPLSDDLSLFKRLARMDWIGAGLSTAALITFTLGLANSQTAPRRWQTPYIPALLALSVLFAVTFLWWEARCERMGRPTMLALSIFKIPHFGVLLFVVFGSMWAFNTLIYFSTLYYQSVLLLSPTETSIRFVPMAVSGAIFSVLSGALGTRFKPTYVIGLSLALTIAGTALFAVIDPHTSYWKMAFVVMVLITGPDLAYTVCNMQICASVDENNQALAGGIFNVAARIGTSVGVAVSSTVSSSVIDSASRHFSQLSGGGVLRLPEILLKGYRSASWVCCSVAVLALVVNVVGLRGLSLIEGGIREEVDIEMVVRVEHLDGTSKKGSLENAAAVRKTVTR